MPGKDSMPVSYNELYMAVRRELKNAGIEQSTLEAKELVCFAANKNRETLARDGQIYVPKEIEEQVWTLTKRHMEGEPIAYIIGEWEFYGLPFDISKDVLIPRVDTEILCAQAIETIRNQGRVRVLDLCCGSGCIGITIAKNCDNAEVTLADISDAAIRISRQNIRRNGLEGRISSYLVDALKAPPSFLGKFDVIVCNPPYIPTGDVEELDVSVREFEPRGALDGGEDGLDFYRSFAQNWGGAEREGTVVLFEIGIGQSSEVQRILRTVGFGDLEVYQDTLRIARVIKGKLYSSL